MSYAPGDTFAVEFGVEDATGAAAAADSTPAGTLRRNEADTAEVVTVTTPATGHYVASGTIPAGWAMGDRIVLLLVIVIDDKTKRVPVSLGRLESPARTPQPTFTVPQNSTGYPLPFRMSAAGLAPTVELSKNGAAAAAAAGTVTDRGDGLYWLTPTAADTGTAGQLAVIATGTNGEVVVAVGLVYEAAEGSLVEAIVDEIELRLGGDLSQLLQGIGGEGQAGARCTINVTAEDTGLPVSDVEVWVTRTAHESDSVADRGTTDDEGNVTFLLFPGNTYWKWWRAHAYDRPSGGESFVAVADE